MCQDLGSAQSLSHYSCLRQRGQITLAYPGLYTNNYHKGHMDKIKGEGGGGFSWGGVEGWGEKAYNCN